MAKTDGELEEGGAALTERASAPHLAALSEKARDYARNARSDNT
ncbi:MAG: integrase, partial [Methylocystis sp.]